MNFSKILSQTDSMTLSPSEVWFKFHFKTSWFKQRWSRGHVQPPSTRLNIIPQTKSHIWQIIKVVHPKYQSYFQQKLIVKWLNFMQLKKGGTCWSSATFCCDVITSSTNKTDQLNFWPGTNTVTVWIPGIQLIEPLD